MALLAPPDVGVRGRALLRKRRIVHLFGMAARSVVMSEALGRVECKSPFGSPRSLRTIRLALISRTSRVHLFGMAARSVVMSEALGRVEWPFLSRKNPYLPTFGQKRQCPLQHDEESVREPDQEIDVHDRPDNPRRKSSESEHAKIGERVRTPRNREIAFVPIPEGPRRRVSRHASSNQGCHVPSFLNGRLCNARHDHWLFGLDPQQIPRKKRNDVRRVTNCKNLRMIRH